MLGSQAITLNYAARIFQGSQTLIHLSLRSQQWTVNSREHYIPT